ncbi:glycosyltransferase [Selenihalanaerobacter shriftii]|uniref:Glycosyltransferase, GT2 family n=1 Tax=Selenihalanaerobacter shriftii TaxID=142842 RepID=A0A1T4N7P4_9FIRM|nr:glycosyltransferase [Selenihalanaerobacter shriftii]SJZ75145.1 Glycosyltransferase, GT2 family [Selenihalanaerobacter shriftii]
MKVAFCFEHSLTLKEEYLVRDLISDLQERLNIRIGKLRGRLTLERLSALDLLITDSYLTAKAVQNAGGIDVIYWFRDQEDDFELADEEVDFKVVTNSKYLKAKLSDALQKNAVIIHPGVKEKFYNVASPENNLESRKRLIVILGHTSADNLNNLMDSLELINQGCQVKVVILDKKSYELNTRLEYKFIHPDSLEAKVMEYSRADLALVISEEKGFDLAPLEVMACRTPAVFIYNQEVQNYLLEEVQEYILHNKNCRLLLNLTTKNLAITVLELLKDNVLAKKIAINGSITARDYSWMDTVEDWVKLIKKTGINLKKDKLLRVSEQLNELMNSANHDEDSYTETVDIVIVNYNTKEEIKDCLESIKEYTEYKYRVIVVDNNSVDSSLEYLESLDWIELIVNQENIGYAKACNQAINAGRGKYILLLNGDVKVTEGWLKPLVSIAESDDEVGIVAPKLINEEDKVTETSIADLSQGWPKLVNKRYDEEESFGIDGAAYLIKRNLIPEIGYLDERYFIYFEDIDYSCRAREKGYKVVCCPESKVYHLHEGSLVTGDEVGKKRRKKYFTESQELFNDKWQHLVSSGVELRDSIVVLGRDVWRSRYQRPQQILSKLSSKYKVLYIDDISFLPQLELNFEDELQIEKINPDLHVLSLFNSEKIDNLSQMESKLKLVAQVINDSLDRLNIRNPILWVDSPVWAPIIDYLSSEKIIYSYMSKFKEFVGELEDVNLVNEFEGELLSIADLILTPSYSLLEEIEDYNQKAQVVSNAVDLEHFAQVYEEELETPIELKDLKSPIVGYIGAIAEWFDTELVLELAEKNPTISIILIGRVNIEVDELEEYDNVYFLGERSYYELPNYLQCFDLCINPIIKNDLTSSVDLVALYEYLAAGKPVVSINLPEVNKFSKVVEVAKDSNEFCTKVEELCREENRVEVVEETKELLSSNTWEDRAEELERILMGMSDIRKASEIDDFITDDINNEEDGNLAMEKIIETERREILDLEKEEIDGEEGFLKMIWSKIRNKCKDIWDNIIGVEK